MEEQAQGESVTVGDLAAKVLVVEDVEQLSRLCCLMLEDAGLVSAAVPDAEAALAELQAHAGKYAVVLTDLTMPGMSGLALIREVRTHWPTLRTILMTGVTDVAFDEVDSAARPDALMRKPFTRQSMREAMEAAGVHLAD